MSSQPTDSPALAFLMRRLDAAADGAPAPDVIPTGYLGLDQFLAGGLRRGDLVLLAGDVGSGKSALALGMALRASRAGHDVLFMSGENTADRLLERIASIEGRFPIGDLRRGRLSEETRLRASMVLSEIRDSLPGFSFIASPSPRQLAEELRRSLDLEFAVVDGLAALLPGTRPRSRELAAALTLLKRLAVELGIALVVTSTPAATLAGRADSRPTLEDLGALGAAREVPDLILGIYREHIYHSYNVAVPDGATELLVLKNRNGPLGYVDMFFYAEWLRFEDVGEE